MHTAKNKQQQRQAQQQEKHDQDQRINERKITTRENDQKTKERLINYIHDMHSKITVLSSHTTDTVNSVQHIIRGSDGLSLAQNGSSPKTVEGLTLPVCRASLMDVYCYVLYQRVTAYFFAEMLSLNLGFKAVRTSAIQLQIQLH